MKRILIIAAVATALAACQKSLPVSLSDSGEICFGTTGICVETKAFTETTTSTLQTGGFRVAAVIDADHSVMFNSALRYNSTDRVYRVHNGESEEHYYYPSEGTMSFYGVYPVTQAIAVDEDGAATLAYSQDADTDLVIATTTAVGRTADPVMLTFDHLLSRVGMTAVTDDANLSCELYSITVNDVDGGTYSFSDGAWTPSGIRADYTYFTDAEGTEVTTTAAAVGSAMSFMPGDITVNAKWKCFNKNGGQLISDNDATATLSLTGGMQSTLNLVLPANSSEIRFTISVNAWATESQGVRMATYSPELLPGVFTVSASGKTVRFAKGNLFWNGASFKCESRQYDCPVTWSANHVGYFFWSSDASIARAAEYNDPEKTYTDTFFAADGEVFEGFTVLDKDEWQYLLNNALAKNSSAKDAISIDGTLCAVLKPDGYDATANPVADSYTAAEWATAEASGLVALPFAGYYDVINSPRGVKNTNTGGSYWTSTPDQRASWASDKAALLSFSKDNSASIATDRGRNTGSSIRLVKVVD